jgi:poly(A) polymerase
MKPLSKKSAKLRTCREVLERLRWDPAFDESAFFVLYEDRLQGVLKIPLSQIFQGKDLVEHRILQIGVDSLILWDREKRLDLLFGSGASLHADTQQIQEAVRRSKNLKEETLKAKEKPSRKKHKTSLSSTDFETQEIPTYRYHSLYGRWEEFLPYSLKTFPSTLTLLTYNVLFDLYEGEKLYTEKRISLLCELLQKSSADIIALQEVTPAFWQKLLKEGWVLQDYFVSESSSCATLQPYGQVLLSRYPLQYRIRALSEHKKILYGRLNIENQYRLVFATLHLTSNRSEHAGVRRKEELGVLFQDLYDQSLESKEVEAFDAILLGDFNSNDLSLKQIQKEQGFTDIWETLYPEDPGYTFNPEMNPLARLMSLTGEAQRLDQFWYKRFCQIASTPDLEVIDISLIGKKPFISENQSSSWWPSDHFGLCSLWQFQKMETPPDPLYLSPSATSIKKGADQEALLPSSPKSVLISDSLQAYSIDLAKAPLVVESACALVPPQSLWPAIQKIRQQYDPAYSRWMPHINLFYPFFSEAFLDEVSQRLLPLFKEIPPFHLRLKRFHFFQHRQNCTLWLVPESDPPDALETLYQRLLSHLPPSLQEPPFPFTPHLTVAKVSEKERKSLLEQLSQEWKPLEGEINALSFLCRGKKTPFQLKNSLPFQGSPPTPVEKRTPSDLELLQFLEDFCASLFKEQKILWPLAYIVGSTRLGIQGKDLDLLALGPENVSSETFFKICSEAFYKKYPNAFLRYTPATTLPILKIHFPERELDIQYFPFPYRFLSLRSPWTLTLEERESLEEKSLTALLSLLDAEALKPHFEEELPRQTLIYLRQWTTQRCLKQQSLGFPGSLSWAILLAIYLKNTPNPQKYSPLELLEGFFLWFSLQNEDQLFSLEDQHLPPSSFQKIPVRLKVNTLVAPYRNSTRTVTRLTRSILFEEIQRALEILKANKPVTSSEVQNSLLFSAYQGEPYTHFICFFLEGNRDFESACGLLESHFLSLILKAENLSTPSLLEMVRPLPPYSSQKTPQGEKIQEWKWGIKEEAIQKFSGLLENWIQEFRDKHPTVELKLHFSIQEKRSPLKIQKW